MTAVVKFPGAPNPDESKAESGVVRFLRELLAQAEAGDIRAIAVAHVEDDGRPNSSWFRGDSGSYCHELVAASAYLHNRLVNAVVKKDY